MSDNFLPIQYTFISTEKPPNNKRILKRDDRTEEQKAGDIKCKNIDPEIRKYIRFKDDEYESFPLHVQSRFLNEATEDYISELKDRMNYRISEFDYSGLYSNKYVDYRGVHTIHDINEVPTNYDVEYGEVFEDDDINKAADEYLRMYINNY